jgi:hypothetical protein
LNDVPDPPAHIVRALNVVRNRFPSNLGSDEGLGEHVRALAVVFAFNDPGLDLDLLPQLLWEPLRAATGKFSGTTGVPGEEPVLPGVLVSLVLGEIGRWKAKGSKYPGWAKKTLPPDLFSALVRELKSRTAERGGRGEREDGAKPTLPPPPLTGLERKLLQDEVRAEGRNLHTEVVEALRRHYFFEDSWAYPILGLAILEAWISMALPVVFYIFFEGTLGAGKTNLLSLVAALTKALSFENVSTAALARTMGAARPGVAVCIDEADVFRGKEIGETLNAMIRQGYKRNAAKYVRWNQDENRAEELPIYGVKFETLRGKLDPALSSRGFHFPSAAPVGEEHYELVLNNLWPDLGDLPERLERWGEKASGAYVDADAESIARSPEFRDRVRSSVRRLGANRDSELFTIAILVCEITGVDLSAELRRAGDVRTLESGNSESGGADETVAVLQDLWLEEGRTGARRIVKEGFRVRQSDLRSRVNVRLAEKGERRLTDVDFAAVRRDLGIKESWLSRPKNQTTWTIPLEDLDRLFKGDEAEAPNRPDPDPSPSLPPLLANQANLTNPTVKDGRVSQVSQVSHPPPPPPRKAPEPLRRDVGL